MSATQMHLATALLTPRVLETRPDSETQSPLQWTEGLETRFFLASLDRKVWRPRLVSVSEEGRAIGIVCTKERKVGGIPTGILYADCTLESMAVAAPERREEVLDAGLRRLLGSRSVRGMRILVSPGGLEERVVADIAASMRLDTHFAAVENHSVLELRETYEDFLEALGRKTRKNFRYYRRRAELEGWRYVESMPFSTFEEAGHRLLERPVIGASREGFARGMRMLTVVDRPLLSGLLDEKGEWASIFGGWYERDRAVMFVQFNDDEKYPDHSISVVMRAYVIETLIRQGVKRLVFWAGTGFPIQRYCTYLAAKAIYLDAPTWSWRAMRRGLGMGGSMLPARMGELMRWVAPKADR